MKYFKRLFAVLLCISPVVAGAQVATTAGSNLTAWNGNSGATNNNNWNQMMNSRTMATGAVGGAPTADFGNCNSLILRCAQPKCSGCTTIDIARPIVAGCVNSNATCKKYGDDLIEFISAQLVSNANAKAQAAEVAAQQAAAASAAQQTNYQMQQMQQQMQQMQQQNAQQMAQMQAALEEQKAIAANAVAEVAAQQAQAQPVAATSSGGGATVSDEQLAAAQSGIASEILVRQQVSGQIMSKIESAEIALKALKASMQETFDYAGCDTSGNNCTGPRRVKTFKDKALQFFDPYNDVLDELYDALITAQAVGVDITDIYMMLNGSCNVWGEYLCSDTTRNTYTPDNCKSGKSIRTGETIGGHECYEGQVVPAEDSPACVLQKTLTSSDEVQRSWLDSAEGSDDSSIRVGCASSALESSVLFRNRKKQATIDIETLERIIEQDAPEVFGSGLYGTNTTPGIDGLKYCAVGNKSFLDLQRAVATKKLPDKVCVSDKDLEKILNNEGQITNEADGYENASVQEQCKNKSGLDWQKCICDKSAVGHPWYWDSVKQECVCEAGQVFDRNQLKCVSKNGTTNTTANNLLNTNTGSGNKLSRCMAKGGTVNLSNKDPFGDICRCNGVSFNPTNQECHNGSVRKINGINASINLGDYTLTK